jgi:hypothetical protein
MAGTEAYHAYPQPLRIQKRLVLNQCFKSIQAHWDRGATINYVTFGGDQLYDVMDFVSVFDIRSQRINIVSYEEDSEIAEQSRTCPVATTLSKVPTISVEIVPTVFFENSRALRTLRVEGAFIYFMDHTKTFREHQANSLAELLQAGLLRSGDWLLITSSLRIVYQERFMARHDGAFRTFFGPRTSVTREFRARNHVDLLVARTFSAHRPAGGIRAGSLEAVLIRKFKYADTSGMGLWLYRIGETQRSMSVLPDRSFEEFPHAFGHVAEKPKVPNIFDS